MGGMVIAGLEPFVLGPGWSQACLAAESKQWYLLHGVTAGLKMCKNSTEEIQDPVKEFSFSLWSMTGDAKWTLCHFHFKKQNWYAGRSCSPFYNSGWFFFLLHFWFGYSQHTALSWVTFDWNLTSLSKFPSIPQSHLVHPQGHTLFARSLRHCHRLWKEMRRWVERMMNSRAYWGFQRRKPNLM